MRCIYKKENGNYIVKTLKIFDDDDDKLEIIILLKKDKVWNWCKFALRGGYDSKIWEIKQANFKKVNLEQLKSYSLHNKTIDKILKEYNIT
jgi:hypothetical protein